MKISTTTIRYSHSAYCILFTIYNNWDDVNLKLHEVSESIDGKGLYEMYEKNLFSLKIERNDKVIQHSKNGAW